MNDILNTLREGISLLGIGNIYIDKAVQLLIICCAIYYIIKYSFYLPFRFFVKLKKNNKASKDLHPFYTYKEIDNATKYFIKTNFQNVHPTEDEEPGKNYIAAAKQPLLPLFLKKIFKDDLNDSKYFLILADSGMGKTTFMINLYLAYKFQFKWPTQHKYNIKLFPLGNVNSLKKISEISMEDKHNTILLLDAFDEDNLAVMDYKNRMQEILNHTWDFRKVIISCRTQFFPSSRDEPYETGNYRYGGDAGEYIFQKIYLSVFSQKDIKKYLRKRFKNSFSIINTKYLVAMGIVLKCPNMMMRPMLLSHIEDLINSDKKIEYSFQIYEILIEEWLNRESNKAGIREKYGNNYKSLLLDFSKALARDLYLNKDIRSNKLSLNVDEIIDNPNGLQLIDYEGNIIEIDKYDQSSRSLLNRNATGEYKFSHKSILEYFLALEVIENTEFRDKFILTSDLENIKRFLHEIINSSTNNKVIVLKNSVGDLIRLAKPTVTNPIKIKVIIQTLQKELFRNITKMVFTTIFVLFLTPAVLISLVKIINKNEETFVKILLENENHIMMFGSILSIYMPIIALIYVFKYRISLKKIKKQFEKSEDIN